MTIVIPDEILHAARMSGTELKQEIAFMLFAREKLTLEQAGRLADLDQLQFQHLLASRKTPLHYDENDLEDDLRTLKTLKRP